MNKIKYITIFITLIVIILSIIETKTIINPEFKLKIVDEFSNPISQVTVVHYWQHYGLENEEHKAEYQSDPQGYVVIPKKTINKSLLMRFVWNSMKILKFLNPHTSWDPSCHIIAYNKTLKGSYSYNITKGLPVTKQLVLLKKE